MNSLQDQPFGFADDTCRYAYVAAGAAELPRRAPVEIELIAQVV